MALAKGQQGTHGPPTAAVCRSASPGVVVLTRGAHRWRFAIEDRSQATRRALLRTLHRAAEHAGCPLNWFDAALIAETLSREGQTAETGTAETLTDTETNGTATVSGAKSPTGPSPEREDETGQRG